MTVFETPPVTQVDRRPVVGYSVYLVAATLFALNGSVSKLLLIGSVPWQRLSQLRAELPDAWTSLTMSPHCDDEVKYRVLEEVVAEYEALAKG